MAWPPAPHGVIIVYPHTSNWDFVYGYLAKAATGLPVRWIGKASLFRWPLAGLLRRMGGIPVRRGERSGLTGDLRREIELRSWLWIAVAPEGTRARTDHLKSGFYRLALTAGVPLGLAFIDYRRRQVGLTRYLALSGEPEADLARVREAYRGVVGRRPERAGEIRFRDGGEEAGVRR